MPRGERKVLECLMCRKKYSKQDVLRRRYFPETLICRSCYKSGAKQDAKKWCFGKVPLKGKPGYSRDNPVCQKLCPDRVPCEIFVSKLVRIKEK